MEFAKTGEQLLQRQRGSAFEFMASIFGSTPLNRLGCGDWSQAVVVACGDRETAAMIDRVVNTATW